MGKKADGQGHEAHVDAVGRKYLEIVDDIESMSRDRERVLLAHFNEVRTYNIDDLEDRDAVIKRLVNREFVYPNAFLASSLGFNKTTWSREYEKMLREVGMYRRPRYSTLRSMLLFEKLKWLVIRFHEAKSKRRRG